MHVDRASERSGLQNHLCRERYPGRAPICNMKKEIDLKEELEKPIIKVIEVVDNPDGTCTIDFETNDAFDKWYLEETGKKRVTERGLSNWIRKLLIKAWEEEDGYKFEPSPHEKEDK